MRTREQTRNDARARARARVAPPPLADRCPLGTTARQNAQLEAMHSGGKAALLEDAFGADASLAAARKADATAAAAARRAEIIAAADGAAAAAAATLSSSTFSTTGDLDEMDVRERVLREHQCAHVFARAQRLILTLCPPRPLLLAHSPTPTARSRPAVICAWLPLCIFACTGSFVTAIVSAARLARSRAFARALRLGRRMAYGQRRRPPHPTRGAVSCPRDRWPSPRTHCRALSTRQSSTHASDPTGLGLYSSSSSSTTQSTKLTRNSRKVMVPSPSQSSSWKR